MSKPFSRTPVKKTLPTLAAQSSFEDTVISYTTEHFILPVRMAYCRVDFLAFGVKTERPRCRSPPSTFRPDTRKKSEREDNVKMEITIRIDGHIVSVEVSTDVGAFLEQSKRDNRKLYRERFLLHALYDLSYTEIAMLCGCSKQAVQLSIDAVRKKFLKFFQKHLDD